MFVILGGVVEFDFSRPLKIIDELVDEGILDGANVLAQRGHSRYVPKNYKSFDFVDGVQFDKYIDDADLVVSHGGVASLIASMKKGKKIIVFPRLGKYHEHLDDHQMEFASKLAEQGYLMYATDKKSLENCIKQAQSFVPKRFVGGNALMERTVVNFIEREC